MNPPPQFIEIVLQYIYKIYVKEFEDKQMEVPEDQRENLRVEDFFDENDR